MSRRKRFWHVAPQYYAGVLVGTLLGVRGPLRDRRVRAGAGQHGTDREQQNRLQTVTTAPRLTRVRNRRQGREQADRLGRTQRLGWQAGLGDSVEQGGRGR